MLENKCLICGGESFAELFYIDQFPILFGAVSPERRGKVKKYPLTMAICDECSLTQQINLLPGSVLDEVYTADYYSCPAPSGNQVGKRVINVFYSFFNKNMADKNNDQQRKLLEVGCFDGYLLTLLQKDSWDIYGCDPAGQTSIAVKNLGEDRIINDFFSRDTYKEKSFDVVIFRHLLEHLYDLHSFLDDIFYVLKDDGCVFIEVPNIYATFSFGGFGSFFHQHISHFSIETLQFLLSRHGFIIEKYEATDVLHVKVGKNKSGIPRAAINKTKVSLEVEEKKKAFLDKHKNIEKKIKQLFAGVNNETIAIFGASAAATTMVNMLDKDKRKKIKGIFDNDVSKHGKFIEGIEISISNPEGIRLEKFDAIIICSHIFSDEIYEQLINLGVDKNKIIFIERY